MTVCDFADEYTAPISIHIPRVGDDVEFAARYGIALHFNPHPPRGG